MSLCENQSLLVGFEISKANRFLDAQNLLFESVKLRMGEFQPRAELDVGTNAEALELGRELEALRDGVIAGPPICE